MILRLMQGFFGTGSGGTESEELVEKGMFGAVQFLFSGILIWHYIYFVRIYVKLFCGILFYRKEN